MGSFQETYPIGQSCQLGTSLVGPAKKSLFWPYLIIKLLRQSSFLRFYGPRRSSKLPTPLLPRPPHLNNVNFRARWVQLRPNTAGGGGIGEITGCKRSRSKFVIRSSLTK